jgi:hypothetical protein
MPRIDATQGARLRPPLAVGQCSSLADRQEPAAAAHGARQVLEHRAADAPRNDCSPAKDAAAARDGSRMGLAPWPPMVRRVPSGGARCRGVVRARVGTGARPVHRQGRRKRLE